MQRLLGKQNDTIRYFYQGYVYHHDKRGSGTIFRCQLRNKEECGAVIYVNSLDDLANQPITLSGRHDHPADHHLPLRENFKAEVLRLALTWEDPKAIFDLVKAKEEYRPIADNLSYYTDYKQKMEKVRKENVPPTPANLVEFGDMLQEYPPLRHLYKGTLLATDGSSGVIMMHEDMRQPLSSCKQLLADGTFKGFPAIVVFASSQTTAMYNAIWEKVLEIIPSLTENVTTIIGDFEAAQIKSFKANFPNARVCGCLFHYKAAIVKKWESLRIQNCEYILEKCYALAHLPAEHIQEGAQHITTLIDRENQVNLQTFGAYLRTYWVPLRDVLSVYKNPVRTNNTCENFHLHAAKRVGVHQGIWKMMTKLSNVIETAVAEYRGLSTGGRHRNWRPLDLQLTDAAIHRYELEFAINRLDVEEFLTLIANMRRLHLSRVFLFDEQQRIPMDDNPINVEEQEFLMTNLNAAPGAGGFLENELQIRRRRRVHEIVDRQLMPEEPQPPVHQRQRPAAVRRLQPQRNGAGEPPVPERRPRGRPPRRALEAPGQNAGPADNAVPEVLAPGIIPVPEPGPLGQVPQVPGRRPRGRPRRRALEAPTQNVEPAAFDQLPEVLEPVALEEIAPQRHAEPRDGPVPEPPVPVQIAVPAAPEVAEPNAPEVPDVVVLPARHRDPSPQPHAPPRIEVVQLLDPDLEVPDFFVPEVLAPGIIPVPEPGPLGQVPQVPGRRPRGRPRRRAREAPTQNVEPAAFDQLPEVLEPVALEEIAPQHHAAPRDAPVPEPPVPDQIAEPAAPEVAEPNAPEVPHVVVLSARHRDPSPQAQAPPRIEVVQLLDADLEVPDFFVPFVPGLLAEPPIHVDDPVVPQVLEHGEPPRKKKRTRRGGTHKKCNICDTKASVQILKPCRHRLCVPCIRNLITRNCPFCRGVIDSYFPHNLMGGERWGDGVIQDIEREWHDQLLRDLANDD